MCACMTIFFLVSVCVGGVLEGGAVRMFLYVYKWFDSPFCLCVFVYVSMSCWDCFVYSVLGTSN